MEIIHAICQVVILQNDVMKQWKQKHVSCKQKKQLILPAVYGDADINKLILTIQSRKCVENILIVIAGTIFGSVLGDYDVYQWK